MVINLHVLVFETLNSGLRARRVAFMHILVLNWLATQHAQWRRLATAQTHRLENDLFFVP